MALTVVLALCAALSNASASVLQRRAASVGEPEKTAGAVRRLGRLLRRADWLAGVGLLMLSAVLQGSALAVGSLSLVQPLLAAELLFTLVVGSLVFRRRPERRTWLAFAALAVGLALFLVAAAPAAGRTEAPVRAWLVGGGAACGAVVLLVLAARPCRGASRAVLLGLASAVCFALTAALLKQAVGRLAHGPGAMFTHWSPYATAVTGLLAFLLLQSALSAGSLAASQPALTLGDALTSIALGAAVFEESIQLGLRVIPEIAGIALIGAGSVGLAHASSEGRGWDTPGERKPEGNGAHIPMGHEH
ncbi:DMT family transporter [Streptomyces sp. AF1A]|jgi:drug/metabolite transporter (DMT)-like permease|uniref:DMT family transporter n=1 Tax=Streptomyces sp. AF1A TaxID=3394350 RepID=UPI0039BD084F